MQYYNDGTVIIRDRLESDTRHFAQEELRQGWTDTTQKHTRRFQDGCNGTCIALVAEKSGIPAGYIHVYPAYEGPYAGSGLGEIVDFAVLETFRNNGIGTRLMETAEQLAAHMGRAVCLSVGLHSGYGAAQRLYAKRGYLPDGSGVWFCGQPLADYSPCINDDDLVLWLKKML